MLRSIPPITSTGSNPRRKKNKKIIYNDLSKLANSLSKLSNVKMVSGIRGHILGNPINMGNPEAFRCGGGRIKKDTWKPTIHKKIPKEKKPKVGVIKDESNDIKIEIHEDKKIYQMIIEEATSYQIKDDILILKKNESEKETLLPKNVKPETVEKTENNGILSLKFKKKRKKEK